MAEACYGREPRSIRWLQSRIRHLPSDSQTVLIHARPESEPEVSEPLSTDEFADRFPNVFAMPKGG